MSDPFGVIFPRIALACSPWLSWMSVRKRHNESLIVVTAHNWKGGKHTRHNSKQNYLDIATNRGLTTF